MALEGLLALLSGGVSGYGQGRRDYRARWQWKPKPYTPPAPEAPLTRVYAGEVTMRPGYSGPVPGRYQPLPTLPMVPAPIVPLTPRKLTPLNPIAAAPRRLSRW